MRFLIGGASGFLGSALTGHLQQRGHEVTRLVRRPAGAGESRWDPARGSVDPDVIDRSDVVVNLAGAPLAHFPWSRRYQQAFRDSRVLTTRTLADAIATSTRKPALIAQTGTAGYGDQADRIVTEATATSADTFLGGVTIDCERATDPARDAGARVVILRTAPVLDRSALVFKIIRAPFLLGLGGRLGSGRQYFATISLHDWLRAVTRLAESATASGAYNLAGPGTTTNAEFTATLARHVGRPARLRVPTWPVRLLAAPVSSEVTGSIRVEPRRLLDEGFSFDHPTLDARIAAALRGRPAGPPRP